jgi:hypothetical protein
VESHLGVRKRRSRKKCEKEGGEGARGKVSVGTADVQPARRGRTWLTVWRLTPLQKGGRGVRAVLEGDREEGTHSKMSISPPKKSRQMRWEGK